MKMDTLVCINFFVLLNLLAKQICIEVYSDHLSQKYVGALCERDYKYFFSAVDYMQMYRRLLFRSRVYISLVIPK